MYSTMVVAQPTNLAEAVPALEHHDAVARLANLRSAMAELDREIGRCTDPRAESCLQTLRLEHEIGYLEALYGWEYELSGAALVR